MSKSEPVTPEVGMGATMGCGSDRYAATIVEVKEFGSGARKGQPRAVLIRLDTSVVVKGSTQDGSAVWQHTPDDSGPVREFTIRPNGKWVQKGQSVRFGTRLGFGHRDAYQDPHR